MKATRIAVLFGLVIGFYAVFAGNANAQCAMSLDGDRPVFSNRTPFQEMRAPMLPELRSRKQDPDGLAAGEAATIVGLWDVKFIVDNQVVDEGFDQYHADGTEILNDTAPPPTGNVCLGVYKLPATTFIKLKHPSWIYDPTNTFVIGKATILEQITVDRSNNFFTGTFTVQISDLDGNQLAPDFSGQLRGDRITP
jgi:hypothetical protein